MAVDDGNLRSSHREMSQAKLKFAPSSLHDLAIQFMETRITDYCIRQRLQPDKEAILKKGTFFVLENESRADPGFLLFLPKQPPVFLATRAGKKGGKPPAWILRMRTDVTLGENGGTLLVATLDKIQHSLRLEDVWVWKGEELASSKTFTQRRVFLKTFVEKCWTPDARLMGGLQTTVANPKPFASLASVENAFSVDLIPEMAGRRRFTFQLSETPLVKQEPVIAPVTQVPAVKRITAYAVPLEVLPDVYDLFLPDGTPVCRAAVQQLALSQQLRSRKEKKIPVIVEWRTEFGRYEIIQCV
jgi:hypothetical protein